eukprot:TRINITY_DN6943_c0_g3_i1.p1 TRINITY_DN6943_c0_g3~~TRINITY_DN6943_c0_g3_i1.p1  ORF type:complete len:147 (-),score=12.08 TRINITY_DN6943_c0_g3_i1:242-682(-)
MTLKSIIQDMKGGVGSISVRRSFEAKLYRSRSNASKDSFCNQSIRDLWANLPPELLSDIIKRIEESEREWPCRRSVVACAGVCKAWRKVTTELVPSPSVDGRITFPVSLKQPGPKDCPIQCFIKRDRPTSTYKLYLNLASGPQTGK